LPILLYSFNPRIFYGLTTIFNNIPSVLCVDDSYVLPTVSDNSITGSWSPVFDSSVSGSTVYTFTPAINECGTSIERTIELVDFNEIEIPAFFTPNNDGVNDYWKIEGAERIQNIRVSIFDRYGKVLNNYDPKIGWNGLHNGSQMPPNDYWYLIKGIKTPCKIAEKKGYFSLLRN